MSDQPNINQDIDYARSILNHNQTLVNFVDTKAGVLLATDGAILALLAGSSAAVSTGYEQLALGTALLLVGISAILGFLTIKPRMNEDTPATKIFFTAIVSKSRQDYKESFSSTPREILDDYLNNIYTLALIQKKKFYYLQVSLYCLILGLVPIAAIIIALH